MLPGNQLPCKIQYLVTLIRKKKTKHIYAKKHKGTFYIWHEMCSTCWDPAWPGLPPMAGGPRPTGTKAEMGEKADSGPTKRNE